MVCGAFLTVGSGFEGADRYDEAGDRAGQEKTYIG